MNGAEVFGEAAHDLRGGLGSLRLVMSSLVDDDDPSSRAALLRLADEEAVRLAAGLAALPALGLAATDRSEPTEIDLRDALAEAAVATTRHGGRVDIGDVPPVRVFARLEVTTLVLPALFMLACGTEGSTSVSAQLVLGRVVISCTGATLWPQARHLVPRLAEAAGGKAAEIASGVSFSLTQAP